MPQDTEVINNARRVISNCNATIVNKQTAVAIGAAAANSVELVGILITKALTGTCVVAGYQDDAGAAQPITFPAATPAGHISFNGSKVDKGACTVTCSNAADALNVIVFWRNR